MPESRTYKPTAVEQAIAAWLVAALDAFPDTPILYANQSAHRPERSFVTLRVLTDIAEQDPYQRVAEDGTVTTTELRGGTFSVSAYGDDSWAILRAASRALRRQDVIELASAQGLEVLAAVTAIQDIPQALTTSTEPRRTQDFAFSYAESTVELTVARKLKRVIAGGEIYIDQPEDGIEVDFDQAVPYFADGLDADIELEVLG